MTRQSIGMGEGESCGWGNEGNPVSYVDCTFKLSYVNIKNKDSLIEFAFPEPTAPPTYIMLSPSMGQVNTFRTSL